MPATVVIEITPGNTTARVHSPFEAKDIIKALPYHSRVWDKDARCWLVSTGYVDQLTALLEAEEFKVQVIGSARNKPPPSPSAISNWAEQMYTALGVPLADLAHKALVRVLHPDVGGSAEAMKYLNAARDRAHGRNHRH